ncbi:hypothetical protein C2S51_021862 [Perilla frutescens var. frutescens]|nr:hypothetical protein C2S51_021862 [Perilla frutescens var. frutescens]
MAADTKHIFSKSGPSYLSSAGVNWDDEHHKRSVLASLVKGVYVRDHDRRKNRQGHQALAPPWWKSFHFSLVDDLIDKHDDSYFGAVYEHEHHRSSESIGSPSPWPRPPRYVIAFRGTVKKSVNLKQDIKLNLLSAMNLLQKTSRFKKGFESALELVHRNGKDDVWLAGHSLGSGLALLVGRKMVTDYEAHLETYLFNPPFYSLSTGLLATHMPKLGHAIKVVKSFLKAGLAAAVDGDGDPIIALSTWIPNLFINTSDPICSPFIRYFEHREYMESRGLGGIERVATVSSIRTMMLFAAGVEGCEALRLVPSAYLTVNVARSNDFKEAHGITQWWRPDVQFNCKLHRYE